MSSPSRFHLKIALLASNARLTCAALLACTLAACTPKSPPMLGTLEWDRVAILAEASEPVLSWAVNEGDQVEANAVLLNLDPRRADAGVAQAQSAVQQANARFAELTSGARPEVISAARAALESAHAAQRDAESEYARTADLRKREVVARSALDRATATRDQRRADSAATQAQLEELTHGTRVEQLDQAAAQLAAAQAALQTAQVHRDRLQARAPRSGRIDAMPFKPGDQPPVGATIVSLLVGDQPYARVFVLASQRAGLEPGTAMQVQIEGLEGTHRAILRSISSEPGFTPYYALTGDDASRLTYRAELTLQGDDVARLPAGLPVRAWRSTDEQQ
ncbi:MAG: HlyD family efflux transporter periplasmic adaptor subunit [Pseudomonadota bacterium]|nr:HlyD family efflux transporter periplasmic adaptor subunit [Pseudomonadota bacterium]